jgi:hypothetical protein
MSEPSQEPGRIRRMSNSVSRWRATRRGTKTLKAAYAQAARDAKRMDPVVRERIGRANLTKADLQMLAENQIAGQFGGRQYRDLSQTLEQAAADRVPSTGRSNRFSRWRATRRGTKALKAAYAQAAKDVKRMDPTVREAIGRNRITRSDLQALSQGRMEQVFRPEGRMGAVQGQQQPQPAQEPLADQLRTAQLQLQATMLQNEQFQLQLQSIQLQLLQAQQQTQQQFQTLQQQLQAAQQPQAAQQQPASQQQPAQQQPAPQQQPGQQQPAQQQSAQQQPAQQQSAQQAAAQQQPEQQTASQQQPEQQAASQQEPAQQAVQGAGQQQAEAGQQAVQGAVQQQAEAGQQPQTVQSEVRNPDHVGVHQVVPEAQTPAQQQVDQTSAWAAAGTGQATQQPAPPQPATHQPAAQQSPAAQQTGEQQPAQTAQQPAQVGQPAQAGQPAQVGQPAQAGQPAQVGQQPAQVDQQAAAHNEQAARNQEWGAGQSAQNQADLKGDLSKQFDAAFTGRAQPKVTNDGQSRPAGERPAGNEHHRSTGQTAGKSQHER